MNPHGAARGARPAVRRADRARELAPQPARAGASAGSDGAVPPPRRAAGGRGRARCRATSGWCRGPTSPTAASCSPRRPGCGGRADDAPSADRLAAHHKAVWRDGRLTVIEADVVDDLLLVDRAAGRRRARRCRATCRRSSASGSRRTSCAREVLPVAGRSGAVRRAPHPRSGRRALVGAARRRHPGQRRGAVSGRRAVAICSRAEQRRRLTQRAVRAVRARLPGAPDTLAATTSRTRWVSSSTWACSTPAADWTVWLPATGGRRGRSSRSARGRPARRGRSRRPHRGGRTTSSVHPNARLGLPGRRVGNAYADGRCAMHCGHFLGDTDAGSRRPTSDKRRLPRVRFTPRATAWLIGAAALIAATSAAGLVANGPSSPPSRSRCRRHVVDQERARRDPGAEPGRR